MRIGVDIKAFKNGTTGIARHLRSILDCLQKLDRENDYILFSCAPSNYAIHNPRWKKIITPWRLPGVAWQQLVLPGLLKRYAIDILWAPEQMCPIFLSQKIRVILTVHDLVCQRFPETSVWSNRMIQQHLLPRAIRRSDAIAPVSDYIARELESAYPGLLHGDLLRPVYNGSPDWTPSPGYAASRRGNFLFFAGNVEPRKNLARLIEALEILLRKHGLTIPLHIAGPAGWKNQSLHSLIDSSMVKENITFLGYLSEEELKGEYQTCKALVYPSLYEGFGLPVLEALSLDCLVLTSEGTVMQEVARGSVMYFDPKNAESIAGAIRHIYDPAFDRSNYLDKKAEILRKYSWEQAAAALLSIMREIHEGTRRRALK